MAFDVLIVDQWFYVVLEAHVIIFIMVTVSFVKRQVQRIR
jgi:hypothetical protein